MKVKDIRGDLSNIIVRAPNGTRGYLMVRGTTVWLGKKPKREDNLVIVKDLSEIAEWEVINNLKVVK